MQDLPNPFFVLAPMDEVTDVVFRQIIAECAAPDLFFTEFVNVDGLQSPGRQKLLKKLRFAVTEKTLIAQLWGLEPENFRKTAEEIADGTIASELGLPAGHNFIGVDLNMGCPAKSEVKNGACSALILNRPLAAEIIQATKEGLDDRLMVSVKTRLGFNEVDLSWIEFLLQQGIDMLTVHGRTRKQMSKVPADWEFIGQARELRDRIAPQTRIIGNGDVLTRQQGLELANKYNLDGIMIGRGVFNDPYVFSDDSPWQTISADKRLALYARQVRSFRKTWQHGERQLQTLNRFCKVYVNGFDGAKELRENLMATKTIDELTERLKNAAVPV